MEDANQINFDTRQLYFVSASGFDVVKIGVSIHPENRLIGLQSSNFVELKLFLVVPNPPGGSERKIQKVFQHLNVRGEWYKLDSLLAVFINTIYKLKKKDGKMCYTYLENICKENICKDNNDLHLEYSICDKCRSESVKKTTTRKPSKKASTTKKLNKKITKKNLPRRKQVLK